MICAMKMTTMNYDPHKISTLSFDQRLTVGLKRNGVRRVKVMSYVSKL